MLGAVTVTPWATPPCSSPPEHPSFHTQLNPILPDLEYLGDQHLLLSVKGVESYESYGAWGQWLWGAAAFGGSQHRCMPCPQVSAASP